MLEIDLYVIPLIKSCHGPRMDEPMATAEGELWHVTCDGWVTVIPTTPRCVCEFPFVFRPLLQIFLLILCSCLDGAIFYCPLLMPLHYLGTNSSTQPRLTGTLENRSPIPACLTAILGRDVQMAMQGVIHLVEMKYWDIVQYNYVPGWWQVLEWGYLLHTAVIFP